MPSTSQVLVLAPVGRDAQIAVSILSQHQISSHICATLAEALPLLEQSHCLVVAEEALLNSDRVRRVVGKSAWMVGFSCRFVDNARNGVRQEAVLSRPVSDRIGEALPGIEPCQFRPFGTASPITPAGGQEIYRGERAGRSPPEAADPGTASPG